MQQNITFSYDFEISKQSLKNVLNQLENNEIKLGQASSYFVKMVLASLTLLENAFKNVNFNFQEETLLFLDKLVEQIKQTSKKDYNAYCSLLGAYFGWCAVKKYNAYFATFNNTFCLIINNNAYSPVHLIQYAIENNKTIIKMFSELC